MDKQAQRVVHRQLDLLEALDLLEILGATVLLELLAEQHRLLIMPMVPLITTAQGTIAQ